MLKALALFYVLTIVALVLGLATAFALHPGAGLHIDAHHLDTTILAQYSTQVKSHGFVEFALHVIPETFVGAFEKGEVLPVLLLALLFGFALNASRSAGRAGKGIHRRHRARAVSHPRDHHAACAASAHSADGVHGRPLRHQSDWLARHADRHLLCGLLRSSSCRARSAGAHAWLLLWSSALHSQEELVIVLATSSTEPVLPRLMYKLERLGCNKGIVGLVLPAGYSFNLDGTAIYLTLASMFIAQACEYHLSGGQIARMLWSCCSRRRARPA